MADKIRYINTTTMSRSMLPVYVTMVESPTLFWVQLDYNRSRIEELEEELTSLMEKRARTYIFFDQAVTKDSVVAVKHGLIWRRGHIININHPYVTIHLGDWGQKIRRCIYKLHQLPGQFYGMSWQAIPCGIYGIKPTQKATHWSLLDRDVTRDLAERKEGWMRIVQTAVSRITDVELRITTPGRIDPSIIKTELIKKKCAEAVPNADMHPYSAI